METLMPVKLAQVIQAFETLRHVAGFGPIRNEAQHFPIPADTPQTTTVH